MQEILRGRNQALLNGAVSLIGSLAEAQVPPELALYRQRVVELTEQVRQTAIRNLGYLSLGRQEILEDVLSHTQTALGVARLLSGRLAIPVLRALPADRLCLKTICWLHSSNDRTANYPAAFGDGACAVWPFLSFAPIYFFPSIEQKGLLYQPLLFHEFGHLLYGCHSREMDDLVGELQREIGDMLLPASLRNDRHAQQQGAKRQAIMDTWYRWAQELFCDAVGLVIGGPAFLYAFSTFLSTMQRGDFYQESADLERSEHPVHWLRVRFLVDRATVAGFGKQAQEIEAEWRTVAQLMGTQEDYHGYYDESMAVPVRRVVDDMLIESSPRACNEVERRSDDWDHKVDTVVSLFNLAWQVYRSNPDQYPAWESDRIAQLLSTP